jgi:purine-nucleoside phosphorylase
MNVDLYEKMKACVSELQNRTAIRPKITIVLGSGLGGFADCIKITDRVPYRELPGFPVSTVAGHVGEFLFGHLDDIPVVLMNGRVHYYEGYSMQEVVMPTRILGMLGVEILFLSNAAGGVNRSFQPGTLMLITDQISSFVPSPLIGPNLENLGTRFPDMSRIYDAELSTCIRSAAEHENIDLREGVYCQFTGPNYESPAEIRMAERIGADAVGMSTAVEAIAARHMGMRVCGVSCITNMAAGITGQELNHQEVQETADRVADEMQRLVRSAVKNMGKSMTGAGKTE